MSEPTTIYRVNGEAVVTQEFPTYAEAENLFRYLVSQQPGWCDLWEITGNSAMQLCNYKRER